MKNNVTYSILLHRLVLMAYYKCLLPAGYEVDHMDRNKSNNSRGNLNLVSHKENCRRRNIALRAKGHVYGRKATDAQIQADLDAGLTIYEIAEKYNYSGPEGLYRRKPYKATKNSITV